MFLVRLIYASTASEALSAVDFQNILTASIQNNHANNLTGMLCCDQRYFLQCLEGSRQEVNQTYARILGDPRHRDVCLLSYNEVPSRHFGDWAMGYVALSRDVEVMPDVLLRLVTDKHGSSQAKPHAISQPLLAGQFLRYSTQREFDPYKLSEASSLVLLRDLADLFQPA